MQVDYIIVGQGISGTWAAWHVLQANKTCIIIDNNIGNSASRMAAGVINRASGKRFSIDSTTENLVKESVDLYAAYSACYKQNMLATFKILQLFTDVENKSFFQKRQAVHPDILEMSDEPKAWKKYFNYQDTQIGLIKNCYRLDIYNFLKSLRLELTKQEKYYNEPFDYKLLNITLQGVSYKTWNAKKIIFAEGTQAIHNPYCVHLPFANTKGEALIISIPDLPLHYIYKHQNMLAPTQENNFWVGASMQWSFLNEQPSSIFREQTEAWLQDILKIKYNILDHIASVRPTLVTREPYAKWLPEFPQVGILNGFGAKACSMAPLLSKQLINAE